MSAATSIPDTQLGLTSSEIQILRQHQQIVSQGHVSQSRGRGTGRNSNSSSRAGSAASSQGRLLLDPGSLSALGYHFDGLMRQIQGRIEYVRLQLPWPTALAMPQMFEVICTYMYSSSTSKHNSPYKPPTTAPATYWLALTQKLPECAPSSRRSTNWKRSSTEYDTYGT